MKPTRQALSVGLLLTLCQTAMTQERLQYDLEIHADFRQVIRRDANLECIPVTVTVRQDQQLLRRLSWRAQDKMQNLQATGELEQRQGRWYWQLNSDGGRLDYCIQLNHQRDYAYDSIVTAEWAMFRADDLFPAAASLGLRNSYSRTRLRFTLPPGWTSAAPFPETGEHHYLVDNPMRRFDRPTGWVQLGNLGIRRDQLAGVQVAVSAPVDQGVKRLEILSMLAFTLPTARNWFPTLPDRLLVVSANDEMWRGALSGPSSIYLHGERPLVSENGTSTLLHELVHVAIQRKAAPNADWIDEGLAEYLSLVLLHNAGGLTKRRFQAAVARQKRWGNTAPRLAGRNSSGAATAKAVSVFADLHQEMGDQGFRRLVTELANNGPAITAQLLRDIAEKTMGKPSISLP